MLALVFKMDFIYYLLVFGNQDIILLLIFLTNLMITPLIEPMIKFMVAKFVNLLAIRLNFFKCLVGTNPFNYLMTMLRTFSNGLI